jgi:F-type H+-transporting ATPase subunit b
MRLSTLLAMLPLASVARAAETAGEAAHGSSGGLPQLDAGSYPSQIFWLVVFFALLYYLLSRKALPRLNDILEARQDRITADLDRAAKLREEAEDALRRYEAMLAEAQERAHALLRETEERLSAEYAQRRAELDRELEQRIAGAESQIAAATERALAGVRDVAAELVQIAVGRLAGFEIGLDEARKAVAETAGGTVR